ncbi:DUF6538 domain-containing protein [Xanthomonas albilineans]|uniref:DUF6538 domain-containing protein n=1 Tax=Xanthomonas albilineans TaxID=29447 RepID=UPI0006992346|nr:DUF6538 domain-containing protein [Xanthomonas albilineans]
MRLPHHLLRHASGVFHFRLVVPRDLHAAIGVRIVKRSLHTRDLRTAHVAAWGLSAAYAQIFAVLRGSTMSRPPSIEEVLAAHARGETSNYVRDASKGYVQTDGPEDHARLIWSIWLPKNG